MACSRTSRSYIIAGIQISYQLNELSRLRFRRIRLERRPPRSKVALAAELIAEVNGPPKNGGIRAKTPAPEFIAQSRKRVTTRRAIFLRRE